MITTYPTCRTAETQDPRYLMLSTSDAGNTLLNPGMLLRVDVNGSLRLSNNWLINDVVNKSVVDDSPYAPATGIAALAFDDSQGIGERSSWSHSHRRRRGVIQT